MRYRLILLLVLIISSCNPIISTKVIKKYSILDYRQEVIVIELDNNKPDNSEVIGKVKVGESGFTTNCSYDFVVDKAKLEARKIGGNAIKIIRHKPPDFLSTCHRITAQILRIENSDDIIN